MIFDVLPDPQPDLRCIPWPDWGSKVVPIVVSLLVIDHGVVLGTKIIVLNSKFIRLYYVL